jgi:hypothetical protein
MFKLATASFVLTAALLATAAAAHAAEPVPLEDRAFEAYIGDRIAPYAPGDEITFDMPMMMRILSPTNRQFLVIPLGAVHDRCLASPGAACDGAVAQFLDELVAALPAAIAARNARAPHDNSLEVMAPGDAAPRQIVPPSGATAGATPVPSDKDGFTGYYAQALTAGLPPSFAVTVSGPLRLRVRLPDGSSRDDDLSGVYGLCAKDEFRCGDGLTTYLTLDISGLLRAAP